MFAAPEIRGHHGLGARLTGVSESSAPDDADGPGSALGGRYYLHSLAGRVRLPGGDSGCVFAASDWLGAGPYAGRHVNVAGLAHGAGAAAARTRAGASLRPRRAICFGRLYRSAARA